jgi:hypothetical protein
VNHRYLGCCDWFALRANRDTEYERGFLMRQGEIKSGTGIEVGLRRNR